MSNQLDIINKFLEFYKTKVNNHSTDGRYNRYSFRLVYTSESNYDRRTFAITNEVEEHFNGNWSSIEWSPYDPVLGHCDCLITLGVECYEPPKIEWSQPYIKDGDTTYKVTISHKNPLEVEKARMALEMTIRRIKRDMERKNEINSSS